MESITIGHISDLHFSDGASDATPHRHSIPHLKQIQSILADRKIDRLVVSGDLTNMGDKESLLRVRDWLFGEFSISGSEKVGLKLPESIVRVIPGNHDAYNSNRASANMLDCWQKSIKNFSEVFPSDKNAGGCNYEWIDKGDSGLYIVYVDSCFLGDPALHRRKEFKQTMIASISPIARGNFTLGQSKYLTTLFDLGMAGELRDPKDDDKRIPKEKFAKSFKLLVMHHYLFEPPDCKDDFFLKLQHRDTVFRNIALADFDMYLCGHKHVNHFAPTYYGEHFDRRAVGRYVWNLFARRLGVNTLPYQFTDADGKKISNYLNRLIEIVALKIKSKQTDGEQFIDELMAALKTGVENPAKFGAEIDKFIKLHKLAGKHVIEDENIQEIQTLITSQLSKKEREILAATGLTYISRLAKGMRSRPFIQSMCGSSAKASSSAEPARSMNIYEIQFGGDFHKVKKTRFNLGDKILQSTDEFTFSNHNNMMLRSEL